MDLLRKCYASLREVYAGSGTTRNINKTHFLQRVELQIFHNISVNLIVFAKTGPIWRSRDHGAPPPPGPSAGGSAKSNESSFGQNLICGFLTHVYPI